MATAIWSPAAILLLLGVLPMPAGATDPAASELPAAEEAKEAGSGCRGEAPPGAAGLDEMRAGLERGVCSTARFVDRLFGREHEFSEYEYEANGRTGLTLGWNELDEFDVHTRFRASVSLPQINERFNATIGRASPDEYIADEFAFSPAVASFSDDAPAEWFAGVGYRAHRARDSRFDLGAGMKLATPLNPYANARYRRYFYRGQDTLLSLRTTAFVENKEGFGLTQSFDIDRVVSPEYLLRFGNSLRLSEETKGVRWRTRAAFYHAIDYQRAMRYQVSVHGETDGTQPDLYGLNVTHRRSMWRDWVFVEFGGGLFWADGPLPEDRCNACIGASIGFEILFGDAYDRVLSRDAERLPADERMEHPR